MGLMNKQFLVVMYNKSDHTHLMLVCVAKSMKHAKKMIQKDMGIPAKKFVDGNMVPENMIFEMSDMNTKDLKYSKFEMT